jgi:outer membrane protein OmpA-like peptidoglycan-associated protein
MAEKKCMFRGVLLFACLALLATGCAPGGQYDKTAKGAAIGAGTGAVLGAIIGSTQGEVGKGAAIGGAIGAAMGTAVGYNMDKQAQELAQIPNTEVVQPEPDRVVITMRDAILFSTNSSTLMPGSQGTLNQIADVMVKYPETLMIVNGHTDSQGSEQSNLTLSERRANAVKNYLIGRGIEPARITAIGHGESVPVADNATAEGRAQNRRVEIEVKPPAQN